MIIHPFSIFLKDIFVVSMTVSLSWFNSADQSGVVFRTPVSVHYKANNVKLYSFLVPFIACVKPPSMTVMVL